MDIMFQQFATKSSLKTGKDSSLFFHFEVLLLEMDGQIQFRLIKPNTIATNLFNVKLYSLASKNDCWFCIYLWTSWWKRQRSFNITSISCYRKYFRWRLLFSRHSYWITVWKYYYRRRKFQCLWYLIIVHNIVNF